MDQELNKVDQKNNLFKVCLLFPSIAKSVHQTLNLASKFNGDGQNGARWLGFDKIKDMLRNRNTLFTQEVKNVITKKSQKFLKHIVRDIVGGGLLFNLSNQNTESVEIVVVVLWFAARPEDLIEWLYETKRFLEGRTCLENKENFQYFQRHMNRRVNVSLEKSIFDRQVRMMIKWSVKEWRDWAFIVFLAAEDGACTFIYG